LHLLLDPVHAALNQVDHHPPGVDQASLKGDKINEAVKKNEDKVENKGKTKH
jgi:hypothetical protein